MARYVKVLHANNDSRQLQMGELRVKGICRLIATISRPTSFFVKEKADHLHAHVHVNDHGQ